MGKREFLRVKQIGMSSLISISVFMCFSALVFIAFRNVFPSWHIDDSEVINIAARLLIIAALFQLFDGVQGVAIGILRGMEDVAIPTAITLIAYWLIAIPTGYYLAFNMDYAEEGIWYGLLIGMLVSSLMLFIRFNFLSSRNIQKQHG